MILKLLCVYCQFHVQFVFETEHFQVIMFMKSSSWRSCASVLCILCFTPTRQEYLKLRRAHVEQLKANKDNPYPHKFHVSISLTDFIAKYNSIAPGEHHADVVSVAGNSQLHYALYVLHFFQLNLSAVCIQSVE